MQFYFIRHGQSANNALWSRNGSSKDRVDDPELTEIGQQQAKLLAQYICQKDSEVKASPYTSFTRGYFGITHIYSSLMVRAIQTSLPISEALQIPIVAWPEIHECGGIYLDDPVTGEQCGRPGKTRSYFMENFKTLVLPDHVTDAGWWNRPYESPDDRPIRARKVYESLIERHGGTDDHVAIVSHGDFYNHLMRVIFDIQGDQSWLLMYNTAITRIDFDKGGHPVLVYHNWTDHLPDDLLT